MPSPYAGYGEPKQPINWARPPSNKRCLYCARFFDGAGVVPSKEHLIGKNFVPVGVFNQRQGFNFIFAACTYCNGRKSRLEGHVSAITQHWSGEVTKNPAHAERAVEKSQREYGGTLNFEHYMNARDRGARTFGASRQDSFSSA